MTLFAPERRGARSLGGVPECDPAPGTKDQQDHHHRATDAKSHEPHEQGNTIEVLRFHAETRRARWLFRFQSVHRPSSMNFFKDEELCEAQP
jgi:hypothetical protein